MAVKKSAIYSGIWEACDKLRGGVEPARYKDYILTLLFVKYVTDRFKGDPWADIQVPDGGSFDDMSAAKGKTNIGEEINKVIQRLAEANGLKGVIDIADFNDEEQLGKSKEMIDKLTGLIAIFEKPELNFKNNKASGDDIIGDAYEYLMKNFAKDSGKSKGQFYTPGEVSRILAKVIEIDKATGTDKTLYDCACGSGSLLIRAADEAPLKDDGTPNVAIYGQEKDIATVGLSKMNLVLHNKATGVILAGNTLSDPKHKDEHSSTVLKRFDYVVSNPPFSLKSWMDGMSNTDIYGRFDGYTMPPEKNGDYAWMLHVIKSMKQTGKGAIILPHGVLFRGNSEAAIRKQIIDKGYIKGIIGLPANLFFGTGIPACIIVLDKEFADTREGIFMIDASKGFIKDGNKNRLREQDIKKIVDAFISQTEIPKYSRLVPNVEIEVTNDYNLNIPRYIDSSEPEDLQDINAHLNGGIPDADIDAMDKYWSVFPNLKRALFSELREGYSKLNVTTDDVATTIAGHKEFLDSAKAVDEAYKKWQNKVMPVISTLDGEKAPKEIINILSEDILEFFANVPLLNKYDVYQILMSYFEETMQDDLYSICYGGWKEGRELSYEYVTKKTKKDGVTVETITDKVKSYDGKVIPKSIIIDTYFADEKEAIEKLSEELEALTSTMEEMIEDMGGDDGLLTEVINPDKNSILKGDLTARMKAIMGKESYKDEYEALSRYDNLMKDEATFKSSIKKATETLDEVAKQQYYKLTIEEIKDLVLNKKWLKNIYIGIDELYIDVSHSISDRVVELAERYESTLSECEDIVEDYEARVKSHLERMGFIW